MGLAFGVEMVQCTHGGFGAAGRRRVNELSRVRGYHSDAMRASALATALLALTLTLPARGDDLPDLGDVSEATLSITQERGIGWNIMRQMRESPNYLDDAEVVDYLNRIGYRLVASSPGARMDFVFFALRDSTVNAFAMPGGYIGVHSGLILTAQSESELASVLAHEISHVTQRHIARLLNQQQRAGMTSLVALALAILVARSNPQAAAGAIVAAQAQTISSRLAFTRDNEREADRVGVGILERAGFDPHAMPVFFDRLQRATRTYETGAPTYLRTHPVTFERIADIQNRVGSLPYRQVPDSLDFHLVRAKLRATQGDLREAVGFFDEIIADRKFNNEIAAHYGLVTALLRAENATRAATEMATLTRMAPPHPMLVGLDARLKTTQKNRQAALRILADGVKAWPGDRSLGYDYADALMAVNRPTEALDVLESQLLKDQNDGRLYELEAKAYAALSRPMMQHKSQAEAYVSAGNLAAAVEQLQIALRNSDGDFYQMSSIEARLSELRKFLDKSQ